MAKPKMFLTALAIVGIIILMMPVALAQEEQIATSEDIATAGITPDKPLRWRIELVFNRITELFSENARLTHAKERLAEVKVMLAQNKPERAQKAMEKFNKSYSRLKDKTEITEDKKLIDNLGQRISAIASKKESLNETTRVEIRELIKEHQTNTLSKNPSISNRATP